MFCLVTFIVSLSNDRSYGGWVEIRVGKVRRTGIRVFGLERSKSSHRKCSIKKAGLENSAIFTGNYLCWSLFIKVAGL